jgi:hypothetical protein
VIRWSLYRRCDPVELLARIAATTVDVELLDEAHRVSRKCPAPVPGHGAPGAERLLEGTFTVDEQGKPRQTITAVQLYEEPIGTPMQARNISVSQPLKILLFQVNRQGEPLAYKAE